MSKLELLWFGFMIVSASTGIVTEAVKKLLTELNVRYYANMLSGIVSIVLSAAIGVAYVVINHMSFDTLTVVYIVGLAAMSWVGAMVGYDKLKQLKDQFTTLGKD